MFYSMVYILNVCVQNFSTTFINICVFYNYISFYSSSHFIYIIILLLYRRRLGAAVLGHFHLSFGVREPIEREVFRNFVAASCRGSRTHWS